MAEHTSDPHSCSDPHCCSHEGSSANQHVFVRGDLLKHFQSLESIAAQLPPQVLDAPFEIQADCLVGVFENYLKSVHSDHQCNHDHHEEHHHEHHTVDPYQEELEKDLMLIEYRNKIKSSYTPLHKHLYDIDQWPLEPKLKSLLEKHPAYYSLPESVQPVYSPESHPLLRLMPVVSDDQIKKLDSSELNKQILECFKEEVPGVFTFDLLPPSFCQLILEEVSNFEKWCDENEVRVNRPNSMNNYGAILDDFGFEGLLEQFVSRYMNVISSVLFPYIGPRLDHHHGFIVAYEMGKDEDLSLHVDDADVTLNLCLGKSFTAGELYFAGVRCNHHQNTTNPLPGEEYRLSHAAGRACIHVGRHRHAATKIQSGERYNLILWCRSSQFRRLDTLFDCPDWCPISAILDSEQHNTNEAPVE